jgi:hypothetical protein
MEPARQCLPDIAVTFRQVGQYARRFSDKSFIVQAKNAVRDPLRSGRACGTWCRIIVGGYERTNYDARGIGMQCDFQVRNQLRLGDHLGRTFWQSERRY